MIQATIEKPALPTEVISVINPATEAVLEEVGGTTRVQFEAAVQRANEAFATWRVDEAARRDALRQCAEILRKRANSFELAGLLTREQGKPKREAINEIYAASHWFASLAELEIPLESRPTESGSVEIVHEPVGIVGAITAWNFPVFLAASKIASALLPGNVVLIKPSPYTPLTTMRMVEMLTRAEADDQGPLPQGVVTVLPGDQDVGNWFVESPEVAHLSFTGSVDVGKRIWENAAGALKPVTLELGGNDAAIVLADADLEQIMEPLFWGAFTNAGQFCTGIKRLFVQESIFEEVVAEMARLANSVVVGDGLQPKTQMGPLANQRQFDRISELVQQARQRGATIVAGGEAVARAGFFYPPTIITGLPDADPLVCDEQFGPVLPIQPCHDVSEMIDRANATHFGLGGSVWTRDEQLASQIARRLECGTAWINQHGVLDPLVPFGGHKQSGIGCEHGWAGVAEFTKLKAIHRSGGASSAAAS